MRGTARVASYKCTASCHPPVPSWRIFVQSGWGGWDEGSASDLPACPKGWKSSNPISLERGRKSPTFHWKTVRCEAAYRNLCCGDHNRLVLLHATECGLTFLELASMPQIPPRTAAQKEPSLRGHYLHCESCRRPHLVVLPLWRHEISACRQRAEVLGRCRSGLASVSRDRKT